MFERDLHAVAPRCSAHGLVFVINPIRSQPRGQAVVRSYPQPEPTHSQRPDPPYDQPGVDVNRAGQRRTDERTTIMMFTDAELEYLASQRLGRIATQKPNGTLQNSPVGFGYNPEERTIDIGGYRLDQSRKFRNVGDNGRVAFVVDDLVSVQPWRVRCVEIRGHAEALPGEDGQAPIIRIHPQRVISYGITEPDTEAHGLVINARDVD